MATFTVSVTRDFGNLADLQLVTAEDMRQVGLLIRERIVRRTLSGLNAAGQAFTPYSPGYAEAKGKALGAAAGANVNLQVSGNMLNQITIIETRADRDEASVTLGWTS